MNYPAAELRGILLIKFPSFRVKETLVSLIVDEQLITTVKEVRGLSCKYLNELSISWLGT